jgi:glutaredoxin
MKTKAIFYHAGCPVCVDAEKGLAFSLDKNQFDLEVIHLGEKKNEIKTAKSKGVKSVPALVIGTQTFHINYGAGIADLEK